MRRALDETSTARGHGRLARKLAAGEPVVLGGPIATELGAVLPMRGRHAEERGWATRALFLAPDAVVGAHRRYLGAGCDVLTTATHGLFGDLGTRPQELAGPPEPLRWSDAARRGIELARRAIDGADVAVAFSVGAEALDPARRDELALLGRALEEERPDLVLVESIALVREGATYAAVATLLDTGIPVWLSFRRCRHGVCGVHGEHWGGPEDDAFGRAARRFEQLGAGALLINCVPPDHVAGMVSWLRDHTGLPLGVYPNLGTYTHAGWGAPRGVGPEQFAATALGWREEGAQIIGGCCGVTAAHIAAAARALAGTTSGRGRRRPPVPRTRTCRAAGASATTASAASARAWDDAAGCAAYPLELPQVVCEAEVVAPSQGTLLVWKHLAAHRIGAGARCLDVACGAGLLTAQLALNGAAHVHAIDVERAAVANTLANAFRSGVARRVGGERADLLAWAPSERYDVVVASLDQRPADLYEQAGSHEPLDYWGRGLFDRLLALLPTLLADGAVAYVVQLSILSRSRTERRLREHGLRARVVDFAFADLPAPCKPQIERVERQSDAYHLTFAGDDVIVAYLLEITTAAPTREEPAA